MEYENSYVLTAEDKKNCIDIFLPHLVALRAKAGASQEEISTMIGVSRQTYGAVERSLSDLSWNTYLSLLMFFEFNIKTHDMLHHCGAFPDALIRRINGIETLEEYRLESLFDEMDKGIWDTLDEQAMQSIRTMIMVEYARCAKLSGEAVIKAFNGVSFSRNLESNREADLALDRIKQKKNNKN